jgi:hypothetical protein
MNTHTTRSETRRRAGAFQRLLRSDSGQGIAEFAMVLPIILVILLGMVEFTNAYDRVHGLAGLSREGANIAARGTGLNEVLTTVMTNGETLKMSGKGGAIVSRLVVQDGQPVVMARVATEGYDEKTRLTDTDDVGKWISAAGFSEGSTHYAVEVFLSYEPVTPLGQIYDAVAPPVLYERAVF